MALRKSPSTNSHSKSPLPPLCQRGARGDSLNYLKANWYYTLLFLLVATLSVPSFALSQAEVLEFHCPSCGYRERLVQGSNESERAGNIQNIIVVCERSGQIRSIKIPLDPDAPSQGDALMARQYGTGRSDLLGVRLPKFLVPGNTCPLFPVTAYLERNICPVDGSQGIQYSLVGSY